MAEEQKIQLRTDHKQRVQQKGQTRVLRLSVEEQIAALLAYNRDANSGFQSGLGHIRCRNKTCESCSVLLKHPDISSAASCSNGEAQVDKERLYNKKSGIVRLNVGGRKFLTRYATLTCNGCQDNFFTSLLSGRFAVDVDDEGYIFIDKNGQYFEQVLDFLRSGMLHCPATLSMERLVQEARFYGINVEGYEPNKCETDEIGGRLDDGALKDLISTYKQARLERNYLQNKDGLQLVEHAIFKGFRAEARRGRQLVVRFWPAVETIISRCRQKWGDVVMNDLPPFMVGDDAHVFDNALYEVCKIGQEGLCWHLANECNLRVLATDSSDYLTTHTYTNRDGVLSINTYAWCVVSTEITPHVYHAAEAVSIVWSPYDVDDPEIARHLSNPRKKPSVKV